jgi:radical SAM/Cys-rich protein
MNEFEKSISTLDRSCTIRSKLNTVQVNMGNLCNQRCIHCHVDAGPTGKRMMSKAVVDQIVGFLKETEGLLLDITGGCPELNPNFRYLIENANPYVRQIMVRNNLTLLLDPEMHDLPSFYNKHHLKLICSMPCYTEENVDAQRGEGVYDKSIKALKLLNSAGFGTKNGLELDLVHNPGGACLPGDQAGLERDYKRQLADNHGIVFNHLITITNAPIKRFEQFLKANGNYEGYMQLLKDNFNKGTLPHIMCRTLLSIGSGGILYDCDFNQALGLALRDKNDNIMEIRNLRIVDLINKEIIFDDHCYCCTAGAGSSCRGALAP